MCGIFFALNKHNHFSTDELQTYYAAFQLLERRGPDKLVFNVKDNKIVGFARLAINDLSENGNQPFEHELNVNNEYNYESICNGEIYNHKQLEQEYNLQVQSQSDCECLIPLYKIFTFGQSNCEKKLNKMFNVIDGVFACMLFDKIRNIIVIGRDRIGVKPLFYFNTPNYFVVSSEAKVLDSIIKNSDSVKDAHITCFPPRSFGVYRILQDQMTITNYIDFNVNNERLLMQNHSIHENDEILSANIHDLLFQSVEKRLMSDRSIGCLLSGGVDSSIVASILSKLYRKQGKKIKTFSIGFPDSTDLKYARKVAEYIESDHHEYVIQYEDTLPKIPEVIKAIETYDITTIRASVPMYLLCKWIKQNFEETVIFSGEGSDEIFGGYLYFHYAPDAQSFHEETIRLISNLHIYDVLRADRCTSANSLELREPFLDKDLIEFYRHLSPIYKLPRNGFEKFLLRYAFRDGYLPSEVLWRRKAAFSDAVSGNSKPWYIYIQEYCESFVSDELLNQINEELTNRGNQGYTKESFYYFHTFTNLFPCYNLKIDYWLPKWINTNNEPSATVLTFYQRTEHQ